MANNHSFPLKNVGKHGVLGIVKYLLAKLLLSNFIKVTFEWG